jgi:hypothetical protein
MADPAELRAKARLCRWAAGIRTTGGARADRVLLVLAEHLEREAVAHDMMDRRSDGSANEGPSETER